MDASCLQYALTEAERLEFAQRGYLVFDEMLPPDMVDSLVEVSDRVDAEERQKRGVGPYARLTVRDMRLARRALPGLGRLAPCAAQSLGNTRLEYPNLPHRPRLQPGRRA